MKKVLFAVILVALAGNAQAGSYFKPIDLKHPQANAGTSIGQGFARPTTMVALITHSQADGYFLIPGVDWTPLAVGGGFKSGSFHLAAGPSFNLLPAIQSGLMEFVSAVTPEDKYQNLKSLLNPAGHGTGDVVGSLGINLEYDFTGKALTAPFFAGVSWKF